MVPMAPLMNGRGGPACLVFIIYCKRFLENLHVHVKPFTVTDPPPSMETLASDLGQIVNDSKFSDCKFLLEGKSVVYAHKAIICARSDYFKAMFVENTRESMSTVSLTTMQQDFITSLLSHHVIITQNNFFPLFLYI